VLALAQQGVEETLRIVDAGPQGELPPPWIFLNMQNPTLGNSNALVRIHSPVEKAIADYPAAIGIQWAYEGDESGLPTPEDRAAMAPFTPVIEALTDKPGTCYLMFATEGEGFKAWVFYASDIELFMTEFNALLADHVKYPLTISTERDEDWAHWRGWLDIATRPASP